ncbi:DNA-dependent RNA polymerase subunit rpo30 [Murmansk poxvirus]|uniref:DNA-directed RNA polymerase 30 kDa polypeptide n=1 Tax=Murmansk poxvirus TaxID=2025359 RepID=A0A223FMM9_9POXV|nr:DNA-dependent RNA polymerase subunit rpo30 [Murmansk poxvirus]AST09251.1 DNA-dependent RNA polymerase subunit rpo30 [Murmansk poxvirus]
MENISINSYSLHEQRTSMSSIDIKELIAKYIDNVEIDDLITWAMEKSSKYYIKNIGNTKSNIEETKFESKNNIGIEYSKDSKNKLSYRNKPSIPTNMEYKDLCDMIKGTSGTEKEFLRYILFGIKCIKRGVCYNIDKIKDISYEKYFNVLDEKYNIPCPNCKSKNTTPMMIQTRAADEPPLVRHACRDCKQHFKPPRFRMQFRNSDVKMRTIVENEEITDILPDNGPSPPDSPEPASPVDEGLDRITFDRNDDPPDDDNE